MAQTGLLADRQVRDPDRETAVLLAGLGLAWRGGGLRLALTVTGVAISIAGVIVAVAFGASLQRLVDTPAGTGPPRTCPSPAPGSPTSRPSPRTPAWPRSTWSTACRWRWGRRDPADGGRRRAPQGQPADRGGDRVAAERPQRDRASAADREPLDAGVGDFVTVAPSGAAPVVLP